MILQSQKKGSALQDFCGGPRRTAAESKFDSTALKPAYRDSQDSKPQTQQAGLRYILILDPRHRIYEIEY